MEQIAVGGVLFPVSNLIFNRKGILSRYQGLARTQFESQERLGLLQLQRLRRLLEYAGQYVPYYRRLFANIGFSPADLRSLGDLRQIPVLSRDDVVEHRLDLVDERLRPAAEHADRALRPPGEPRAFGFLFGGKLVRNTSSGSTGTPTVFYEDGSITAASWANELRLRSWFGISPGARESRMARISAENLKRNKKVLFRRWFWNQHLLPGVSLTEADYARCAREIREFEPRVLWGFTSAAAGLARYLIENPGAVPKKLPELVITWAAPLYEHEEQVIREVFRCEISNVYGTRELGHMAARCPQGGMHVNQESVYLETEESKESEAGNGPGELLATSLVPSPMPFIRYRTGDLGALSNAPCRCGRTLQVIREFTGRTGEVLITKDGRMISPNFWCRTFMDPALGSAVKKFQVVYKSDTSLVIRIVRGASYTEKVETHLRNNIVRNLFGSARVNFEYPLNIKAQVSGKYQMVINETKTHERTEASRSA
jgi:phenylacetate-CoA ligase